MYTQAQKDAVFASLRRTLYSKGFPATAVPNLNVLLDATYDLVPAHAAYVLATAYHEVGQNLQPIRENMNYTAARIRQVWPSRPEARVFANNPQGLANSVYANRMGNGPASTYDGWNYRGGGYPQLTGRAMYEKFGIADAPERMLEPEFAARVTYKGMVEGLFTGRKLSQYDVLNDPNARAIVNADANRADAGSTVGRNIMRYANAFHAAIMAGRSVPAESPNPIPVYPVVPVEDPFDLLDQAAALIERARKLLKEKA